MLLFNRNLFRILIGILLSSNHLLHGSRILDTGELVPSENVRRDYHRRFENDEYDDDDSASENSDYYFYAALIYTRRPIVN